MGFLSAVGLGVGVGWGEDGRMMGVWDVGEGMEDEESMGCGRRMGMRGHGRSGEG